MRFMMIVKANTDSEADVMPTEEMLACMGAYNAELVAAGVMVDGMGLQSSAKGARIHIQGDQRWAVDGPFTESKELIAGFWIINVASKEEAVAWAMKVPNPHNNGEPTYIDLRRVFENEDFGDSPAVKKMAELGMGQ